MPHTVIDQDIYCATGMIRAEPFVNIDEDYATANCTTERMPISQVCPKNTRAIPFTGETPFDLIKVQERVLLKGEYYVETEDGCASEGCPPETTPWKEGCITCPAGTKFDLSETLKAYKKGAIDTYNVLCLAYVSSPKRPFKRGDK